MNKLYSILTYKLTDLDDSDYYWKKREHVHVPDKAKQLVDDILADVPVSRVPLFACFVCHEVAHSVYSLKGLDDHNTYAAFSKDPNKAKSATCVHDLLKPADEMKNLVKWLDSDLKESLTAPTWVETMGACCIQLLRWC